MSVIRLFLSAGLGYRDGIVKQLRAITVPELRRFPAVLSRSGRGLGLIICLFALALGAGFDAAHSKPHKKAARSHHHAQHKPARHKKTTKRRAPERTVTLAAREPAENSITSDKQLPIPVLSRDAVLNSDAGRLARIGRHLIVGYHSFDQVKALVEKQAIAGIFITDHNVRGRRAADVKADIEILQDIRRAQGLPPLIVAADQEGGQVSRLSPPLKKQPSLALILKDLSHDEQRRPAVEAYAQTQADELKRIGVTLNFAPVVDLKLNPRNRDDGETQLRLRAIAADPYLVSKVAGWYCDVFAKAGLMCTLKHFPGLGRVQRDTHVVSGEIAATEGQLELNDWVPFRRLMDKNNVATMLGHVRVSVIDKSTPASFSHEVIHKLIRGTWHHDGLLITDDLSMGAVTRSKGGVGAAAVKALNAGADLLLVSYTEEHYDKVMSALLDADAKGNLDAGEQKTSAERIARVLSATADQN